MQCPFIGEEVKQALFQMHPTKALVADGMHAIFYQKLWNIVGEEAVKAMLNVLNYESDHNLINHTFICLFPKVKNPVHIKEF